MSDGLNEGTRAIDDRPELMWWGTPEAETVNDGVRLSVRLRPHWGPAVAYEAEKELADGLSARLGGAPVVVSIDANVVPPLVRIAADRIGELDPRQLHDLVEILARSGYDRAGELAEVSGRGDISAWEADLRHLGGIPPSWKA